MALLCPCRCHQDCPLWPAGEVPDADFLERCSCPGGERFKETSRRVRADVEVRKAARKEAVAEVSAAAPNGHAEILQALDRAYQERGLDIPKMVQEFDADLIEAGLTKGRPQKDLVALRAFGRLSASLARGFWSLRDQAKGYKDQA